MIKLIFMDLYSHKMMLLVIADSCGGALAVIFFRLAFFPTLQQPEQLP